MIHHNLGHYPPLPMPPFFNNQEFGERNKNAEYLSRKKRPVAWFVSNCDTPSNRMEYVKGMF